MALQFTYCKIGKGVMTDGSLFYDFYGKDFNPNVPSMSSSLTSAGIYDETSTFNLTGFQPGHEVGCSVAIITNNDTSSRTQYVSVSFQQNNSTTWTYNVGNVTVGPNGAWKVYYMYFGIDYDEIWSGISSYKVIWDMLDDSTNASFSVSGLSIDSTKHSPGYLWIEGENLCYVDATYSSTQGYKHKIQHDSYSGGSGEPGYIWIPSSSTNQRIYYTDAYGTVRRTHVASDRYSPTGTPNTGYVGTQYAGKIRVPTGDMEDGYGYLCYVDSGGYKRRMGNGTP